MGDPVAGAGNPVHQVMRAGCHARYDRTGGLRKLVDCMMHAVACLVDGECFADS